MPLKLRTVCKDSRKRGLFDSFRYAFRGIIFAVWSQRNMKIHIFVAVVVMTMGVFFKINRSDWLSLVLVSFFVIITETINTAIEVSVDLVTKKLRLRAMVAKDIAAGAVMLASCCAVLVGIIIFAEKILVLLSSSL